MKNFLTYYKHSILVVLLFCGILVSCSKNKQNQTKFPISNTQEYSPNSTVQSVHVALGVPADTDASDDYIMVKPQYVLSYNHTKNVANWVSMELNNSYYGLVARRAGQFMPDNSLPAGWYQVKHGDYTNSGYDRGHLCRSEERTATRADNDSTFLCTNLLPQFHDLNAGPWLRLEEYCEKLCKHQNKELFVIAGGIFRKDFPIIGHGVAVPDSCFKIVVVLEQGQGLKDITTRTQVIAVKMPNITGIMHNNWQMYQTTVDAIELSTGYNFLSNVPNDIQQAIESRVDGVIP